MIMVVIISFWSDSDMLDSHEIVNIYCLYDINSQGCHAKIFGYANTVLQLNIQLMNKEG